MLKIIFNAATITLIIIEAFGDVFAQVPETLWTRQLQSQCYGSPACADIDGDGFLEIVFGTYFDDEHAYALNAEDGSIKWRFDVGGGPLDAAPVIADVDLDDSLEVIIPASWGIVFCLKGNGTVQWRYPRTGYIECIDSPPAVADVDEDGLPEIIFGAWYGKIYVLNAENGTLGWQRTYDAAGYIQSEPCILDSNNDGHLDIAFGLFRGDHKLYSINGQTGDTLWTYQAADWIYHGPATADIDGDGMAELVVGDYSGTVYALNAENGTRIWQRDLGSYIFAPITIAELVPSSPGPEILAAVTNTLFCLSAAGTTRWSIPTGGNIERGAIVSEIDGDPALEVIFGSQDRYLRVANGESGTNIWLFQTDSGYPIGNAPIVADFDNDGWKDVFCIGGRGYSDTIGNYGKAYAITAGSGIGDDWKMFRHDLYRTGYHLGGPSGIVENTDVIVTGYQRLNNYPNPFNHHTIIRYYLSKPGIVTLDIYDILGRKIETLDYGSKPAGLNQAIWNAEKKSSGVYFYNLKTADFSETKKLMLIK
jgi:outer membrane protein assembly factor BamB